VAAEPRWSPDGSRIAFLMSPRGHLTRYAGDGDICVMNANGTDIRRLTDGLDASSPAWSPDGSRIVFVKGQGQALVVMSARGSDQHVIARARGYYEWPAWSPDGHAIAYQSHPDRGSDITAIFRIQPDGTGDRQLTPRSASGGFPAWSRSGSRIAYSASERIWVMNSNGTKAHGVTDCRLPCVDDFAPAWSPDGSELVFVRQEDGGGARRLYVLELSTRAVRALTPGIRWASSPDWRQ
jgi:TolB protein